MSAKVPTGDLTGWAMPTNVLGRQLDRGIITHGEYVSGMCTALTGLHQLFDNARGDHAALADVRQVIAREIDRVTEVLTAAGVDVAALLDDIEAGS